MTKLRVYGSCSRTGKYLTTQQIGTKEKETHPSSQVFLSILACGTGYTVSGLSADAEEIRSRNTKRTGHSACMRQVEYLNKIVVGNIFNLEVRSKHKYSTEI